MAPEQAHGWGAVQMGAGVGGHGDDWRHGWSRGGRIEAGAKIQLFFHRWSKLESILKSQGIQDEVYLLKMHLLTKSTDRCVPQAQGAEGYSSTLRHACGARSPHHPRVFRAVLQFQTTDALLGQPENAG